MSRPSFMNFGQSGKKSPLGRAAINRMTTNLITAQKNYVNRRSTVVVEKQIQPIAHREMWKEHEDEDKKSEKRRQKKKGRFRTVKTEAPDMEVFETEDIDSDEPLSDEDDEDNSDVDDTIMD